MIFVCWVLGDECWGSVSSGPLYQIDFETKHEFPPLLRLYIYEQIYIPQIFRSSIEGALF
jgi:hypothetical protein